MKKVISAVLTVALLVSALAFTISAGRSTQINSAGENSIAFDVLQADKWNKVSCVSNFKNTDEGALIVYPQADSKKTAMTFSYTFDSAVTISDINEFCLEARVASNYDKFAVKLSVYGENGVYSDTTEGMCGVRSNLYFKFPEGVDDDIVKIQFTVTAGNEVPDTCTVFSIYADNCYSYSYIDLFDTVRFSTVEGNAVYTENSVILTSDGSAAIDALLARDPSNTGASIVLSLNSTGSGIVNIENLSDGKKYQSTLYSGTNTYTFFLEGIPEKIRLSFSHGEGTGNARIVLKTLELNDLGEKDYLDMGTVSSCIFRDNTIYAKGTITSDAAVKYINTHLGLFRTSLSGEMENEPIAKIKISTVFELSAKEKQSTSLHRYTVAIIAEDGIHPITEPMFATSYTDASKTYSQTAVGLLNPDSFDAFKADAPCVMIDVNAESLLADEKTSNAVMYSHNEKLYSIDYRYFEKINRDIRFYNDLNCEVYLRINVANQNSYNEHTLKDMQAVLSYLSLNATGVTGYALMPDYNTEGNSTEKASYAALILGCLSETVRRITPQCEIYYGVSNGENIFAAHISHYAKSYGLQGISAVYTVEKEGDMIPVRTSVDSADFKHVILEIKNPSLCSAIYESAMKANIYAMLLDAENEFDIDSFRALSSLEDITYELRSSTDMKGEADIWNFRDNYSTFGFVSGGKLTDPQTYKTGNGRALRATLQGSGGVLLCRVNKDELNLSAADGIALDFLLDTEGTAELELIIGYTNGRRVYCADVKKGSSTLYADIKKDTNIEYIAIAVTGDEGLILDISSIRATSATLDSSELRSSIASPDTVMQRQMTIYYIIGGGAIVLTAVVFILLTRKKENENAL